MGWIQALRGGVSGIGHLSGQNHTCTHYDSLGQYVPLAISLFLSQVSCLGGLSDIGFW